MTTVDFFARPVHQLVSLIAVGLYMLAPASSVAQEPTLADLQQQWAQLDTQLTEKQAAIDAGGGDTNILQNEFRELIEQANTLVNQIKTAALTAIGENPTDNSALRALMGVLLNDASNGREKEVLSIGDRLIAANIDPRYFEIAAAAERLTIADREIFEELLIRQREAAADDLPRVKLTTSQGEIVLELYENQAPNTVANFISLVESGHYSDVLFHRVLEGFMAQAGEKKSDGSPPPKLNYTIECECYTPETRHHFSDCLSMAHGGRNTGAGQFFLTFSRTNLLDGLHTCFGRVISGSEVLEKIARTHIQINGEEQPIPNVEKDKIILAEVIRKRDHAYQPVKFGQQKPATSAEGDNPSGESKSPAPIDVPAQDATKATDPKPEPPAASDDPSAAEKIDDPSKIDNTETESKKRQPDPSDNGNDSKNDLHS